MIEVTNLIKDYGNFRAVDNVSLQVNRGDILGFLGPNGAGKSTTMKMITGFLTPTAGTAVVGGFDVQKDPIEAKKRIGYLPESAPVYSEMTVIEFLQFLAEVRGFRSKKDKATQVDRALGLCHLESVRNQSIETLSKGYRQRVGFAQAILHNPPVLIMDEPTDGLDPNQKKEVRNLIKAMSEDKAIIISTHILEEVDALCNRAIIIAKGKIVVDETPEKLRLRNPHCNALKVTVKAIPPETVKAELEQLDFVEKVEAQKESTLIFPKDKKAIEETLLNVLAEKEWALTSFSKVDARLDEVFWELTT